ncbi:MAG: hypothetical protein R2695_21200 [Acidimicrobiales bacterium]
MSQGRLDPFLASLDATQELWNRLARPFDTATTVDALLGLSPDVVEQLVGVLVATCDEAEALLDSLPRTLRKLKTSIGSNNERCIGELRGPVQWSETLAAQGSSLGNRDVFVCASTRRAYDIEENQVLVGALRAVVDAGAGVDRVPVESFEDDGLRRARHNAKVARRFLDHRTLEAVSDKGRPSARALKRTRSGKSAAVYRPALAMLQRVDEPLSSRTCPTAIAGPGSSTGSSSRSSRSWSREDARAVAAGRGWLVVRRSGRVHPPASAR